MAVDKSLVSGSTSMLILRLLEEKDMYGYEMIAGLRRKSRNVFELKAGTLYPLLHGMESEGLLKSYTLLDEVHLPAGHVSRHALGYTMSDTARPAREAGNEETNALPETGKRRRYYRITKEGRKALARKKEEWMAYSQAVVDVLSMGGAV